jgi:beta/gamma crystallin
MPHVILFKESGFFGDHKHVLEPEINLNVSVDSDFNDAVQSFWILDGNWQFFKDWNYETPFPLGSRTPAVFGPGPYRKITDALGPGSSKQMSSLRPVELVNGVWTPLPEPSQPGPIVARKSEKA